MPLMTSIPPANLAASNNTPINQIMLTTSKVLIKLCFHPDETGFSTENSSAISEIPARFEILADEYDTKSAGKGTRMVCGKECKNG